VSDSRVPLARISPPAASTPSDHRVRNDIEGLRALAVLSVLINHSFPKVLPGGFAGVDVFFVISGYLIGRHLLQDIASHRFSFLRFYAKRARRILPALALVLICVLGIGWLVLSAPEFFALGRHVAASSFFANNVLLWTESGYFDVAALDKPLLHLWSLGIEEQFYLLVPALLWLGIDGSGGSIRWVARLAALSLTATIVLGNADYTASFFLLHTRFWELAAGVALAQAELRISANGLPATNSQSSAKSDAREVLMWSSVLAFSAVVVLGISAQPSAQAFFDDSALILSIAIAAFTAFLANQYLNRAAWHQLFEIVYRYRARFAAGSSIVGISLICVSIATLSDAYWPGSRTLFPVLGAVLFIAATPTARLNQVLALKPLAFVGGISYPLYLWHWPVIVFFRLLNPDARGIETLIPLVISFALAWLTKIFVETPIRFGRLGRLSFQRAPLWPVGAGLGISGLLGAWIMATNGLPSRFPPTLRAIAEWSEKNPDSNWRVGTCYYYTNVNTEFPSECTPSKRPDVPRILLWGDSHAAHLYPGLANLQATKHFDIVQWTSAGCPPTVEPLKGEPPDCPKRRATAWGKIAQLKPDLVVLGGAWGRYLELGLSQDDILGMLSRTVRRLKNESIERIIIFGPGPLFQTTLPNDLFRFMSKKRLNEIPARFGTVSDALWHLDGAIAALADSENIQYESTLNYFCDTSGCLTVGDRTIPKPDLLYRDRDHLTVSGSRMLIEHSNLKML
jgi:peptidoglycan/LPS O-acetylase OafA/YrhL